MSSVNNAVLLTGAAAAALLATPVLGQDVPTGPGTPGNCNPATETCTTGGPNITVGVDTTTTVGVDVDNDVDVNNEVNAHGGNGGNGYGGNGYGGSVGDIRYSSNNVNVGGSQIGAAISGDGCAAITGYDVRIAVMGTGGGFGRNTLTEVEGCRDFNAAVGFFLSDNPDVQVTGAFGLMNGRSGDVWRPAIEGAARGTLEAEARCEAGATRRSVFNAVIQNGCIQGEAAADTSGPANAVYITVEGGDASAEATATGGPAARGAQAGGQQRRGGGQVVSQGTVRINGQECSVTIRCPAPASR